MKLGAKGTNPLEQLAIMLGIVPTPAFDTFIALLLARTVMVGTKCGIFETLDAEPLPAAEVAARCDLNPQATAKLLGGLAGAGYLHASADGRFSLAPIARRWLLKESALSLRDAILFLFVDAHFIDHMEDYVRTGAPLHVHETMSSSDWELYQRALRAGANLAAPEVARRIPLPAGARDMLDIGGSHGYYSVALCRRHPGLRATVLDLPEAITYAAPLLAREAMGDRVVHRAGDALTTDLGVECYDLVLIAQLVHHFDDMTNRDLVRRVARALRPGGVFVIAEVIRSQSTRHASQIGALTDLYFGIISESGTWSFKELADWQRAAGLLPRRPIRLLTAVGGGLQVAVKPR